MPFTYRIASNQVRMLRPFPGSGWMVYPFASCSLGDNGAEFSAIGGDSKELFAISEIALVCKDCGDKPCVFALQEKGEDDDA